MKPDYGRKLHEEGVRTTVGLCFYDVPIDHLSVTDIPSLTTVVNLVHGEVEYAVSFDFEPDAAAEVLARSGDRTMGTFKKAAHGADPTSRTFRVDPPILISIEATLGALQQSATEVFAPLLVRRLL
jgi:hypothetical protein